jgi:hypothetical protein
MKQEAAANFSFIEPMQALSVKDLPAGGWLYEMKFDGSGRWLSKQARKCGCSRATVRTSMTITRSLSML